MLSESLMTLNSGMHFLGVIFGSRSMYPREAFQGAPAAVIAVVVAILCHGVEVEAEAEALLAAGAVVGATASTTASLQSANHHLVQCQSHDLGPHLSLTLVQGAILCLDHCPGPGPGPGPSPSPSPSPGPGPGLRSVCQPHINLELGVQEAVASAGAPALAGATADHILVHLRLNLDKVYLQLPEAIKLKSHRILFG